MEIGEQMTIVLVGKVVKYKVSPYRNRAQFRARFVQASLCKIQGLLKYFPTVFKD